MKHGLLNERTMKTPISLYIRDQPFLTSELVHPYHLDEPIFSFRGV